MSAQSHHGALSDLERLRLERDEAVDQQLATSQVLEAIGQPRCELGAVFDTVVHHAVRLCRADSGMIWKRDGDVYRLACAYGGSAEYRELLASKTIACASGATPADEIGMVGLVGLERTTVTIDDARNDPRYEWPEALEVGGQRSMLGVPMLVRDQVLGVIVLNRNLVEPFEERTVDLATTFATQGAIALENVAQAEELATLNRQLEQRVDDQVTELERLARLKRFLPPQLVDLVVSSGDESFLESHRREITVVFCDLRGFTAFAETVEPEDVMDVLSQFHGVLGRLVHEFEGTLDRYSGDGMMAFFNDPMPCDDGPARATRMAVAMRVSINQLVDEWSRMGHDLNFGIGVAQGHATLGRIGFEGRFDYTAIGSVTNLAARLCAAAAPGQILVSQRVHAAVDGVITDEHVGDLSLKGFSRPMPAYNVVGLAGARPLMA